MQHHSRRRVCVVLIALLLSACTAGADRVVTGAEGGPVATPADSDAHAHHATDRPSADAGQERSTATDPAADADRGGVSVTEQTLETLLAMDPDRLSSAHDHHGADHAGSGAAAVRAHPNGIDPERIVVPAIGVDADVIELGLQADGSMEVPSDFSRAGWFGRGPRPGRVGPAVIVGHVDSRSGPAVFFRLTELSVGDLIEVHGDGGSEVVTFEVRDVEQHPKDAFPTEKVYTGTPGAELRLITCGGAFDADAGSYRDNVVVYAERIAA